MPAHIHPTKFLLPGVFLFVLGLGNILVGQYKEWQYTQVYEELSVLTPTPKLPSVMGRIQAVPQIQDRHARRQIEANERRNLYRLVAFGGKTFMSFSAVFFCLALLMSYRRSSKSELSSSR